MKKLLFLLIPLIISGFLVSLNTKAGTGDNVAGFAWSENIGWISFNNTSGGGATNYGVNINETSGNFSGYAWSENIGWIDFAPSGPYPASPNYSACLDFPGNGQTCDGLGSNKVGGWARALSYGGGWDGWIKLRGTNYGIDYTPQSGELSGYAWSDMAVGWISFNCSNQGVCAISNYKVTAIATQPPSVSTAGETWNHCSVQGKSIPVLSWDYSDGIQTAYWVQIDNTSASFQSPEVDTGEVLSSSSSYAPIYTFNWNTNYWWRVKAKNQQGIWSNWSNVDNFTTPAHAYPWSDFIWSPLEPTQEETIAFDPDTSQTFGGTTISSYLWTIIQGTGSFVDSTSASSQYSRIQFSTLNNTVRLEVADSDGYICYADKDVIVQLPLPDYKEIPPIIWLKKILASAGNLLTKYINFDIL